MFVSCFPRTYKVSIAKGSVELLHVLGFLEVERRESSSSVFGTSSITGASTSNTPIVLVMRSVDCTSLESALSALNEAADALSVSPDERPIVKLAASVNNEAMSNQSSAPAFQFDPFKPNIVRASNQPPRLGTSSTEQKLQQLSKRRQELEGAVDDVERCTDVLFPRADGTVADVSSYLRVIFCPTLYCIIIR